jgi:hypothetical protein
MRWRGPPRSHRGPVIHAHKIHSGIAAAVAAAALLAGAATASAASVQVSAHPALTPAFKPSVHDYVARCSSHKRLKLHVTPASGGTASVRSGHPHRSAFSVSRKLKSGQAMTVSTRHGRTSAAYHVRCLPAGFPNWTSARAGRTQAGFYMLTPVGNGLSNLVVLFDPNGVPVWWYGARTNVINASLLPNGNFVYSRYRTNLQFGLKNSQAFEEHTLSGRLVRVIKTVGSPTDIHEFQRLPNGDSLLISYKPRDGVDLTSQGGPKDATVLDGVVQEVTPAGKVVFNWNSKDHIALDERSPSGPVSKPVTLPDGRQAYDIMHLNSIQVAGKRLIISARAPSAVYEIERSTGAIVWKLGGTQTPQSLNVVGDSRPAPHFGGQHDARLQPDGTITIHDNATGRGLPPRAVRFRVDPATNTATLVEQLTDPRVPVSNYAGSARKLAGGNWVVSWGGTPVVGEYTAAGAPVFTLRMTDSFFSYRAFPVARGQVKIATLRRAMDRRYGR